MMQADDRVLCTPLGAMQWNRGTKLFGDPTMQSARNPAPSSTAGQHQVDRPPTDTNVCARHHREAPPKNTSAVLELRYRKLRYRIEIWVNEGGAGGEAS
jgi:hypothetical protein